MRDTMKPTYTHLKGVDEFKALKLIEANGSVHDGFFGYNEGWSDERIAKEVGCSVVQIQKHRREIFGDLRRASLHNDTNSKRIDTLEIGAQSQRVKTFDLERRVESIERAFNLLFTKTGQNGLSDDDRKRLATHFGKPYQADA